MRILLFKRRGYCTEENHFGFRPWLEMPAKILVTAAYLDGLGIDVSVRDDDVYEDDFLASFDLVVGWISLADGLYEGLDYLRVAKKRGCITALVLFDDWQDMQRQVLANYDFVDFGIRGVDTEINLEKLIGALDEGKELSDFEGLVVRKDGDVVDGGTTFHNPDNLHHLPSSRKWIEELDPSGYDSHMIQVASGCPFKCTFCFVGRRNLRFRKVEDVVDELECLPEGAEARLNCPDLLGNTEWARNLSTTIISRGLRLRFYTDTRINWTSDKETLELLHRAGCFTLAMGVESYHPDILKALKKGYSPEVIDVGIKNLIDVGIEPRVNLIVGSPMESEETLKATEQFIRDLPAEAKLTGIQYLRPTPGSEIHRQVVELGLMEDNAYSYEDLYRARDVPSLSSIYLSRSQIAEWRKRLEDVYSERQANSPTISDNFAN